MTAWDRVVWMIVLVSGGSATVRRLLPHPNLGVLICPAAGNVAPRRGTVWAADNSAFSGFDKARFLRMLGRIEGRDDCLFVTAPDVVGDHEATLERWPGWAAEIRAHGLRPAFVAQDGCLEFPEDAGALFIGGTTGFKLGAVAAELAHEARRRGLWSHMGRVNSARRILRAAALVDSCDGSSFSRFSRTHLPWALSLSRQAPLPLFHPKGT